jgi:hypothetical protein
MSGAMQHFVRDIADWAEPTLAAPLLATDLGAATAERLLHHPRFAARASAALVRRLPVADTDSLDPRDHAAALSDATTLTRIAARAGGVWNAHRLRRLLLACDIAPLIERFGEDLRAVALRHAALAVQNSAEDELADAIERDGARCLATWIDAQPAWAAARIRLKWCSPQSACEARLRATAVTIVRAVSAERGS